MATPADTTDTCAFCQLDSGSSWTNNTGQTFIRCEKCRTLSKECRKGTGLFFNVQDHTLHSGDHLSLPLSPGRVLVLDLHGVVDLLPPEQLRAAVKVPAIILSFVGSTTDRRIEAHQYIKSVLGENIHDGWMCFHKRNTALPGTKGGFMKCLTAQGFTPVLFDDSLDNCQSAADAGCEFRLIDSVDTLLKELAQF